MKIGLDAKRAFLNNTGLGNYSRHVIKSLLVHYPQHEYYLFTPKIHENEFYNEVKDLRNVKVIQPNSKLFANCWRSYGITKIINKLQLDVYHGLSNELPFNISRSKVKKIVTIHDLIPYKEDAFRNVIDDYFSKRKMRKGCKDADMVTPISKATADDIVSTFGTAPKKIQVVYQPAGSKVPDTLPDVKTKYRLPPQFILQVGTIEYRKNIQIIIRAMIQLRNPELHFVIVGRKTRFYKSLASYGSNNGLGHHLHFIDPVSNDELAGLYSACTGVVYPALYEGFGLPIVEAISYGKPVLTTKGGCFEEAGGPGAYYCNTESVEDVAATLTKMLEKDNSQMISAGKQYITKFTSKAAADALMECYHL